MMILLEPLRDKTRRREKSRTSDRILATSDLVSGKHMRDWNLFMRARRGTGWRTWIWKFLHDGMQVQNGSAAVVVHVSRIAVSRDQRECVPPMHCLDLKYNGLAPLAISLIRTSVRLRCSLLSNVAGATVSRGRGRGSAGPRFRQSTFTTIQCSMTRATKIVGSALACYVVSISSYTYGFRTPLSISSAYLENWLDKLCSRLVTPSRPFFFSSSTALGVSATTRFS